MSWFAQSEQKSRVDHRSDDLLDSLSQYEHKQGKRGAFHFDSLYDSQIQIHTAREHGVTLQEPRSGARWWAKSDVPLDVALEIMTLCFDEKRDFYHRFLFTGHTSQHTFTNAPKKHRGGHTSPIQGTHWRSHLEI